MSSIAAYRETTSHDISEAPSVGTCYTGIYSRTTDATHNKQTAILPTCRYIHVLTLSQPS
jgi:hypothetical protein